MKKTYLVTCYFKHNYGSALQAFATQYFLDINGISNQTVSIEKLEDFKKGKRKFYLSQLFNFPFIKAKIGMVFLRVKKFFNKTLKRNLKKRDCAFKDFQSKHIRLTKDFSSYRELSSFCESNADNVVVGSDQLWLPVNVVADYYTLNFVPDSVNKVSYATSFGISSIPKKYVSKYRDFLLRFDYLSVREETGRTIVKTVAGIECEVVCDPTFLLTKDQWIELIGDKPFYSERYVFCYFLGKNRAHRKFAERLAKLTGCKIVSINHCDEYVKYSDSFADFAPYDVDPFAFLNLIYHAQYVCTDSFHGSVFSLQFNKRLFSFRRHSYGNKFSTNTRLDSLFKTAGYDSSICDGNEDEETIKSLIRNEYDYERINLNLEKASLLSRKWFINSLK